MGRKMFRFSFINESKVGIEAGDQSELYHLRQHFSYIEKCWATFMGKPKAYVNTYSLIGSQTFGFGLLKHAISYCEEKNIAYVIDKELEERIKKRNLDIGELLKFFKKFKFYSKNIEIIPRKDQVAAVLRAILHDRVVNVCPTSFGKSLCIFMQTLYNLHIRGDKRNVIIVPTVGLVEQFASDIKDYCTSDGKLKEWFPRIQTLSSGKPKELSKSTQIFITTWQSLMNIDSSFINLFDHIILDEAHKGAASWLKKILNAGTKVRYRTGWTGTLNEHTIQKIVVESLIGPAKEIISTAELMEDGIVADLKIVRMNYNHPEKNPQDYFQEIKHVEESQARNMKIMQIVENQQKKSGLILFQHLKHGKLLYRIARRTFPEKKIFLIDGSQVLFNDKNYKSYNDLKTVIESFDDVLLICSFGVFSLGVNIKNIHWIMFGITKKSYITVIQSIGRGLRISDKKRSIVLYDVIDNFASRRDSYSMKHAKERMIYYTESGFNVMEEDFS
jgi:superfamily II DNA or RNA helicase